MKYIVFDKDTLKKELVFCTSNETEEEIMMKGLPSKTYIGKFNSKEHVCVNGPSIKNDSRLFILVDTDGVKYIFQFCGRVTDCENFIIPHTYYIRKIGVIVE